MFYAVTGNNYGDEGKGLAVDYLTLSGHNLVVRHNGGAQAGHTVDREDKRFVFHELSSGSFNGADTYWAATFLPDFYILEDEIKAFSETASKDVKIYASPSSCTTLVYDVFLNQKREEARGSDRHGSCGMGIWEATKRSLGEYRLTLGDIDRFSVNGLSQRLKQIEKEYVALKVEKFGLDEMLELDTDKYASVLKNVLADHVTLIDDELKFFMSYDNVVFEGAQGLLLDSVREDLWPHTTCSRTNIVNPVNILNNNGLKLDEAVYVTRSYLTRHGAGPFEADPDLRFTDETNPCNPWQGTMRFGRHESLTDLIGRAVNDCKENCPYEIEKSMLVTHLNETADNILTQEKRVDIDEFADLAFEAGIDNLYLSRTRFSTDITVNTGLNS